MRQWLRFTIILLAVVITGISFNYGTKLCYADEDGTYLKQRHTAVAITFEKSKSVQSDVPPTRVRKNLPSTGELVNSIILSLIGCSLFIFFVGIYCFKEMSLEDIY